ncbi:hypothetical protein ACWCPX_30715 [Streptomyces olivaceoviridis]
MVDTRGRRPYRPACRALLDLIGLGTTQAVAARRLGRKGGRGFHTYDG